MKYLLDSNTCIVYLRDPIHSSVAQRFGATQPGDAVVCSVVRAELMYGALHSGQRQANLSRLHRFLAGLVSLPFDDASADAYGSIREDLATKGIPIGPNDLLIAAIAVANNLVLITHNTGEFGRVQGLQLEDWQV